MKAVSILGIVMMLGLTTSAQSSMVGLPNNIENSLDLLRDGHGRPLYMKTEVNFVGSPFWPEAYQVAKLTIKNGTQYHGVQVKVNLLTHLVLFKATDGTDMEVTAEVRTIAFSDTTSDMKNVVLMNGFPNIDAQTATSFYQLLDSGKTKLLKTYAVSFDEKTQYGYAGVTRELVKKPVYYLYMADGSMKKLDKGKNALLKLFPDKTTVIEDYLKKEKLKLQKEAEMMKAIQFINQLPTTS